MTLRPELRAPAINPGFLARLATMIGEIANAIERGEDVGWAVDEFTKLTGRHYDITDFRKYWQAWDAEDFARQAARRTPEKVPVITRDDLIEIVQLMMDGDEDADYYQELFDANVPHPNIGELLFVKPDDEDDSAERIVDKALAYRPFAL
ncbi:hypothetical protein [Nonomuraea turcica]|uniref:hypothetical protein n=1 Tax=Nonomuraea sp. G32 TaxID=3067274 RepID=UPI00273C9013|nr:hypothetical protein [Nonomuraea sp. G32]MDP4509227.1 hypothetical protein [Nonomuraea sp. G32]